MTTRHFIRSLPALAASACLFAFAPGTLAAQQGMPTRPAFQQVIRLAQDGYGDSARTIISRIIDRTAVTDSAYPEALYTAATVARSGEDMRLLFSRVTLEFSRSSWADDAMLRLAQLDYGSGNPEQAVTRIRRFMNDYPTSPVLPIAALWGARAAFERQQAATACDWLARGVAAAGDDVESRNQLEFARSRCTGTPVDAPMPATTASAPPPMSRDTARGRAGSTTTTPAPPPATNRVDAPWRIQVGALTDEAAIRRTIQQIEQAGFTAYRVAGPNGMTKIQAGPFATRDATQAQLAKVKAAVRGDGFVTRVQ
jgi:cell division septation protein DedD